MDNCPNCGANVSIYDKFCPYCGRQNHITVDDIMNTPIKGGYVTTQEVYEDFDVYRDLDGRLHKVKIKSHKTVTITEY